MPKVALIQDGTEVARQRFADVAACFERCRELLDRDRFSNFELGVFTDGDVSALLEHISPVEWNCVVFASNALLSARIDEALAAHERDMQNYVRGGGGIVVLHQMMQDGRRHRIPHELSPSIIARPNDDPATTLERVDERDILLRYPISVACDMLRDLGEAELRASRRNAPNELPKLFYTWLDANSLPSQLKPVLRTRDGRVILARSVDYCEGRVVVSTMPLDWQQQRPGQADATCGLLANIVRYAAAGVPRRLVWWEPLGTHNELLVRWLGMDDRAAVHPAPDVSEFAESDAWLLSHIDVFALHPDRLDNVVERPEVTTFLDAGGAIVAPSVDDKLRASRIVAVVGRHSERVLAARVFAELRAVEGWRAADSAFDIRNIVAMLSFLWADPTHRINVAAICPTSLDDVRKEVTQRLRQEIHRQDLGSSIALAEVIAHLDAPDAVDEELVAWMESESTHRPFDVALQIRAVLALARRQPDLNFLAAASEAFATRDSEPHSAAPVARALEAVAILDQADLLGDESAVRAAEQFCSALTELDVTAGGGWLSVEATASIVRGLVALYRRVAEGNPALAAEVSAHIATGATALRRSLPRYTRGPKGVAWLARIAHAVVVADRQFPVGLERLASLDWPHDGEGEASLLNRALLEDLATKNEALRHERQEMERELTAVLRERRAAKIGRAVITLASVSVIVAGIATVIMVVNNPSSTRLLVLLPVALALLVRVLVGVFVVLRHFDLLAGPAETVRAWVEDQGIPILSDAATLRGG